jgi:hypothetical protein
MPLTYLRISESMLVSYLRTALAMLPTPVMSPSFGCVDDLVR